jgi:hypothetical protein
MRSNAILSLASHLTEAGLMPEFLEHALDVLTPTLDEDGQLFIQVGEARVPATLGVLRRELPVSMFKLPFAPPQPRPLSPRLPVVPDRSRFEEKRLSREEQDPASPEGA